MCTRVKSLSCYDVHRADAWLVQRTWRVPYDACCRNICCNASSCEHSTRVIIVLDCHSADGLTSTSSMPAARNKYKVPVSSSSVRDCFC